MEAQRVSIAAVTRSLHVWFKKISTPLYHFYGNNSKRNPEDTTDVNISSETCREMQTAGQKMWKQLQGSAAVRSRETCSP